MFALPDKWVWDFWLARDGGLWHMYFLQADKSLVDPELRHWHATHGHATSPDLRTWDYRGTCLEPQPAPAWDDYANWTGSVVRDDDGLWHLALYIENGRVADTDASHLNRLAGRDVSAPSEHMTRDDRQAGHPSPLQARRRRRTHGAPGGPAQ